jgi:hypothetical protein
MRGDGFLSVVGTTGIKPAIIAYERTEARLVAGDKENERAPH